MNEEEIGLMVEENQRMKALLEKIYHFMKHGTINSKYKIEKDIFQKVCLELGKEINNPEIDTNQEEYEK